MRKKRLDVVAWRRAMAKSMSSLFLRTDWAVGPCEETERFIDSECRTPMSLGAILRLAARPE